MNFNRCGTVVISKLRQIQRVLQKRVRCQWSGTEKEVQCAPVHRGLHASGLHGARCLKVKVKAFWLYVLCRMQGRRQVFDFGEAKDVFRGRGFLNTFLT